MKNFYKIAIATLTTAVMSASALAAPHDAPRNDRFKAKHPPMQVVKHDNQHWKNQHKVPQHRSAVASKPMNVHAAKPMSKWQAQHKLPSMYQKSAYRISAYQHHQLSKPGHNQQWYKVDGHYLLTDTKTDRIIKVVRG